MKALTVLPNSGSTEFDVTCETAFTKLMLYNIAGKVISEYNYSVPQKTANISVNLEAGTYFIMASNERDTGIHRFIIE